jgi:hypothetical protein
MQAHTCVPAAWIAPAMRVLPLADCHSAASASSAIVGSARWMTTCGVISHISMLLV